MSANDTKSVIYQSITSQECNAKFQQQSPNGLKGYVSIKKQEVQNADRAAALPLIVL